MKRLSILLCLALMVAMRAWAADTYTSLWQQYNDAVDKGQPRTAIGVLDQITSRATTDKAYGHLVKAQIARGCLAIEISPDSLTPVAQRMEKAEQQAKDPVLRAVYATVLGNLYAKSVMFEDQEDAKKRSREYYTIALKDKDLLAKTQAKVYEPTVERGYISKSFGGDLLHVIGCEAKEYAMLNNYYNAHGNRRAACMAACLELRENHKTWLASDKGRQNYQHKADSLINIYQDLDECGELAIEHYRALDTFYDNRAEQCISYIDMALAKWGTWPRMNILRNKRAELTQPQFNISLEEDVMLPGKERKIHINSVRNIRQITLNIYRLGKNYYNFSSNINRLSDKELEKLKQDAAKNPVQTITRQYYGYADYQTVSDSAFITPLTLGNYLIKAEADVKGVDTQYALLSVSNLCILAQKQPGTDKKQIRIVVVNATSGNPVGGATVTIKQTLRGKDSTEVQLKTDDKGETIYNGTSSLYIRATHNDDVYSPFERLWTSASYRKAQNTEQFNIFTDRSIYRPGQTVYVAVTATCRRSATEGEVLTGRSLTLKLNNANGKPVAEQQVITDLYGTAHSQFVLPTTGLTGNFSICCNNLSSVNFKVEEYKRPTFKIEWDTIRTRYEAGDTLTITGRAITYAGVPVQQAKVTATAYRRTALWWWCYCNNNSNESMQLPNGTTDNQGQFSIRLPLKIEDADYARKVFYTFDVSATVTDGAGESQEAQTSVPLGTRATALVCDIDEQIERDSIPTIHFYYRNSGGQPIDGQVTYTIDDQHYTTEANHPVDLRPILKGVKSGRHQLTAICGSDTLTQNFILFSASDSHTPIDTPDWFYLSSHNFSDKGKVRLQLGSSASEQYVVYTLCADNLVIERGSFQLKGQLYRHDFSYRSEYGDGLTLTYAWVKDGEIYTHSERIARPMPDKRLQTRWTSFRDRLIPGQKETWTLHISQPNGKPAEAQMTATLYDQSLDALYAHNWYFNNVYNPNTLSNAGWKSPYIGTIGLYSYQERKTLTEDELTRPQLTPWNWVQTSNFSRPLYLKTTVGSINAMAKSNVSSTRLMNIEEDNAGELASKNLTKENTASTKTTPTWTSLRENFNETAFFYPTLETNEKGDINISFTLPETVTTWKFMGVAHDRSLNTALVEATAVAQKKVMVQPNMPRFVRNGDNVTLAVRITNTTAQKQSGKLIMTLTPATSQQAIVTLQQPFQVEANATATVNFSFTPDTNEPLLICKTMATGEGWADGEQHYLPLLSNYEQTVNTLPFTLNGTGSHTLNTANLFDPDGINKQTTIEYTDNPAWLMIQALPALANPSGDNAISLVAAYYANAIARHIINSSPSISQAIKLWRQQPEESLTSVLEKNESLKQIVLAETPWLATATHDTERMRSLARYLDINQIDAAQSSILTKLTQLQNSNGLTAWWKGMTGNIYITTAVAVTLARLEHLTGTQTSAHNILTNALDAMDKVMANRVKEMKESKAKNHANNQLTDTEISYLYASALAGRKSTSTITYLLDMLEKQNYTVSISDKAQYAVTMALYGRTAKAKEYLQSAREYTVFKEGMGRYYDTPLARYSWLDYRIPTQVATIEALKLTDPSDTTTISEMQQWLLQEKRTTAWNTPVNSVNAIYAFLLNNTKALAPTETKAKITVDGKQAETSNNIPMIGAQTYQKDGATSTVTINKPSAQTSWGAIYASMLMPIDKVKQASSGLSIKRCIIGENSNIHIGDKVTVRITIHADRDYDFVEVKDKRAACLEPTNQLSGYRQGCYVAPHDSHTSYFFDKMSKGTHTIETTYYVDRTGNYHSGQCTAVCAYSPAFAGRTAGTTLHVNP